MWTMSKARRALPAALVAIGVLVSAPACSAGIYSTTRAPHASIERRAYDDGYRQGFNDGRNDVRRHRSFSFGRHDEYRSADRRFDRDPSGVAFRRGFEAGYRDAFDRGYGRERR